MMLGVSRHRNPHPGSLPWIDAIGREKGRHSGEAWSSGCGVTLESAKRSVTTSSQIGPVSEPAEVPCPSRSGLIIRIEGTGAFKHHDRKRPPTGPRPTCAAIRSYKPAVKAVMANGKLSPVRGEAAPSWIRMIALLTRRWGKKYDCGSVPWKGSATEEDGHLDSRRPTRLLAASPMQRWLTQFRAPGRRIACSLAPFQTCFMTDTNYLGSDNSDGGNSSSNSVANSPCDRGALTHGAARFVDNNNTRTLQADADRQRHQRQAPPTIVAFAAIKAEVEDTELGRVYRPHSTPRLICTTVAYQHTLRGRTTLLWDPQQTMAGGAAAQQWDTGIFCRFNHPLGQRQDGPRSAPSSFSTAPCVNQVGQRHSSRERNGHGMAPEEYSPGIYAPVFDARDSRPVVGIRHPNAGASAAGAAIIIIGAIATMVPRGRLRPALIHRPVENKRRASRTEFSRFGRNASAGDHPADRS